MYKIVVGILRFLSWPLLRLSITGEENLPVIGPVLICFNHVDLLDSIIMIFAIKRDMWGLAASNYKYNPLIFIFWLMGRAILIDRGEIDRTALDKSLKVLKSGKMLGVAPEGTRHKEGLQLGKAGIAYLAKHTDPLIVPVGIAGSKGAFKSLFRKRICVTVVIGEPFKLNFNDESLKGLRPSVQYSRIVNEQIMPRIAALIPLEMRGVFG